MIEIILADIKKEMTEEEKINKLRENLQILVLKIMSEKKLFQNISFVGGTALRIIYGLNRFSEDLDFSLDKNTGFDFMKTVNLIQKTLKKIGIESNIKTNNKGVVKYTFFKFSQLLYELKLSKHKEQNLSIKIEIDTRPPEGAEKQISIINKIYIFPVVHYNLPSLFSGKLHALLFRKYVKARDYYDLFWYLTKKVEPNYTLLNNAIKQTEKIDLKIDKIKFKKFLLKKIEKIDFLNLRKDIKKFLINSEDAELLTEENLKNLIINF